MKIEIISTENGYKLSVTGDEVVTQKDVLQALWTSLASIIKGYAESGKELKAADIIINNRR